MKKFRITKSVARWCHDDVIIIKIIHYLIIMHLLLCWFSRLVYHQNLQQSTKRISKMISRITRSHVLVVVGLWILLLRAHMAAKGTIHNQLPWGNTKNLAFIQDWLTSAFATPHFSVISHLLLSLISHNNWSPPFTGLAQQWAPHNNYWTHSIIVIRCHTHEGMLSLSPYC